MWSLVLASARAGAGRVPFRSFTKWWFVPNRLRSVGCGPVLTPLLAARDPVSMNAWLLSIRPGTRSRHSNSLRSPPRTPTSCQSNRCRRYVMPEPHSIWSGNIATGCRSAARTGSLSILWDRSRAAFHPAVAAQKAGRSGPVIEHGRRGEAIPPHELVCPVGQGTLKCLPNPSVQPLSGTARARAQETARRRLPR